MTLQGGGQWYCLSVIEIKAPFGGWQAEKLSQAQLFELLRTIIFWTVGIPVPSGAVQLVVFLPNSRYTLLLLCLKALHLLLLPALRHTSYTSARHLELVPKMQEARDGGRHHW